MRGFYKFLYLTLTLLPFIVHAQIPSWKIDPSETKLTFTATQNGAPLKGEFKGIKGEILFDPQKIVTSSVNISVDINSASASYPEIVKTLERADFLDVKDFKVATFKSNHITKVDDNTYSALGDLTIRDVTKPTTIIFSIEDFSAEQFHAKGAFTIKRNDFGVGQGAWESTDELKDEVNIEFQLFLKKNP